MKFTILFILLLSLAVSSQHLQTTYSSVPYMYMSSLFLEYPAAIDVEKISSDDYLEIANGSWWYSDVSFSYNAKVSYSINNGSGSYYSYTTVNTQSSGSPNTIDVNDVEFGQLRHNTRKDLAVARDNRTEIYRNASNTLALIQSNLPAGNSVSWGKYNNDNWDDLCISTGSQIRIYLNLQTGYVNSSATTTVSSSASKVLLTKLDSDEFADLIYSYGNYIYTRKNNNGSGYGSAQSINFGTTVSDIKSEDINGDGYYDLIACGYDYAKMYLGTSSGTLNSTATWSENDFDAAKSIAIGDVNNDNLPDVVVAEEEGKWNLFLNTGSGSYFPSSPDESNDYCLVNANVNDLVLADVENTGGLSLLMATGISGSIGFESDGVLCLFKHNGDPAPAPPKNLSIYQPYMQHPVLSWDGNTETDFKEYKVYRTGTDYDGGGWNNIATTTNTSYTDNQVYCGGHDVTVTYKLKAVDDANNYSNYSNAVGIWVIYKPPVIGDDNDPEKIQIPTEFSISQNYPNPFNPETNITFGLPQDNFVNLVVYNIQGEKVATLVNEQLNAGSYIAKFDASLLPSGVYIYKIQAGSFSQIKRMLLIK